MKSVPRNVVLVLVVSAVLFGCGDPEKKAIADEMAVVEAALEQCVEVNSEDPFKCSAEFDSVVEVMERATTKYPDDRLFACSYFIQYDLYRLKVMMAYNPMALNAGEISLESVERTVAWVTDNEEKLANVCETCGKLEQLDPETAGNAERVCGTDDVTAAAVMLLNSAIERHKKKAAGTEVTKD